nr:unnamed protein product [Callosobruchus chinensis]
MKRAADKMARPIMSKFNVSTDTYGPTAYENRNPRTADDPVTDSIDPRFSLLAISPVYVGTTRRAIRLIGDPALTCHLNPLSHRRGVLLVTSHFSTVIQTFFMHYHRVTILYNTVFVTSRQSSRMFRATKFVKALKFKRKMKKKHRKNHRFVVTVELQRKQKEKMPKKDNRKRKHDKELEFLRNKLSKLEKKIKRKRRYESEDESSSSDTSSSSSSSNSSTASEHVERQQQSRQDPIENCLGVDPTQINTLGPEISENIALR